MQCFIGLDVGTTASRAVAFDPFGRVLAAGSRPYPLRAPYPGWAEQDADEIVQAVLLALQECANGLPPGIRPRALGLSSVLHSLLLLDDELRPLTPLVTWGDVRATPEAEELKAAGIAQELYRRTLCPVHAMYLPAKLRWFSRRRPEVLRHTRRVASIKEYVSLRLTGTAALDLSLASGTGLFNAFEQRWDPLALEAAGIDEGLLAQPVEPETVIGTLQPEAAARTGLPADLPVVAGAGDGMLSTLGCAAIRPGMITAMVATSGAVRGVHEGPRADAQGRTWCYYLARGRWVSGAAINNAGVVYRWLSEQLDPSGTLDFDALDRLAAGVPPGAAGLVCLPFLLGERGPYWNGDARGVVFGLSLAHTRAHLARAVIEGVCFRMRSCVDTVEDVLGRAFEIRATGGALRSELWQQTLADCLGRPLVLVDSTEASALGAAFIAMLAVGVVQSLDDISSMVHPERVVEPRPEHHPVYDRLYDLYMRLYWKLQEPFHEIARFQREEEQGGGHSL